MRRKYQVDVIIVSKTRRSPFQALHRYMFVPGMFFDASNELENRLAGRGVCQAAYSLHAVPADGAFVLDIGI